jgi:hypothetical protein
MRKFIEATYVKKYRVLYVKAAYTHEFKDRNDDVRGFAIR